ncbi:MAG: tRNA (adenosine(37)-N6)-threonylcarbamoyltransferase complex dimerization subunit type 1 TsaB [Deltaproteobacteria bacterium]
MRVLGIETSSIRGSVALVEGGQTLVVARHERANAHEASIQPLIERALADAGWSARQLDRIAVGTGPGSFTGLRVGIALAQGISEGLEIPLVGVGSLRAMAHAAPGATLAARVPLLDARRGEFFLAAYDLEGRELLPPQIVENARAVEQLVGGLRGPALLLGRAWDPVASNLEHHRSEETDLPHARAVALLGAELDSGHPVRPLYLRPPVATAPRLEPNPLSAETRSALAPPASEGAAALGADHPERQR